VALGCSVLGSLRSAERFLPMTQGIFRDVSPATLLLRPGHRSRGLASVTSTKTAPSTCSSHTGGPGSSFECCAHAAALLTVAASTPPWRRDAYGAEIKCKRETPLVAAGNPGFATCAATILESHLAWIRTTVISSLLCAMEERKFSRSTSRSIHAPPERPRSGRGQVARRPLKRRRRFDRRQQSAPLDVEEALHSPASLRWNVEQRDLVAAPDTGVDFRAAGAGLDSASCGGCLAWARRRSATTGLNRSLPRRFDAPWPKCARPRPVQRGETSAWSCKRRTRPSGFAYEPGGTLRIKRRPLAVSPALLRLHNPRVAIAKLEQPPTAPDSRRSATPACQSLIDRK